MILKRTFGRRHPTRGSHRNFSLATWLAVVVLSSWLPALAADSFAADSASNSKGKEPPKSTQAAPSEGSAVPSKTDKTPFSENLQGAPASTTKTEPAAAKNGEPAAATKNGEPAAATRGEPPAATTDGAEDGSTGEQPAASGEGQPAAGVQQKPPLSPEVQPVATVKIPPGKLAVAIILPNFEQFHRAFHQYGREYSNRRLSATESLIRAKLQKNGCYIISEEVAHATSAMIMEVYLRRAAVATNLIARGYQINGGISRYKRTPGRIVRIGYNSLGQFDQLYSVDDFEMKALMIADVFLDRTNPIRKGLAASAGGKKPAKKGKKG